MKLSGHKGHFLKAIDLEKPKLLTIKAATVEIMEGDSEQKEVLWFEESEQGLVLNKTNTTTVVEVTGTDDVDIMAGKKIVLFATTTEFGGKTVPCIRVRAPKNSEPAPPQDEIPF